jgi:putative holliday junction resolvase
MGSSRATSRSATRQCRRILAIDYGRRRIGLAISDELRLTASPLATIVRKNRRDDMRRLREIVQKNEVGLILVGSPVHLGGQAGEMAAEAARFAERAGKELGLPVALRDERLTSWEAEEIAKETGSGRKAKNLDSMAAAILLREHLDETHNGKSAAKGQ